MEEGSIKFSEQGASSKACVVYLRSNAIVSTKRDELPREEKSKYSLRSVSVITRPRINMAFTNNSKISKTSSPEKTDTCTKHFSESNISISEADKRLEMKENLLTTPVKYRKTPGRMRGSLARRRFTEPHNVAMDPNYDSFRMDLELRKQSQLYSTPTTVFSSKRRPYIKKGFSTIFPLPKGNVIRAPRSRIRGLVRTYRPRRARMRGIVRSLQREVHFPPCFCENEKKELIPPFKEDNEKTRSLLQVMFNLPKHYLDIILEYCDFKLTETMLMIKHLLSGEETNFSKSFALVKHHMNVCLQFSNPCNCWFGKQLEQQNSESEPNPEALVNTNDLSSVNEEDHDEESSQRLQREGLEGSSHMTSDQSNLDDEETFGSIFRQACEVLWGPPIGGM